MHVALDVSTSLSFQVLATYCIHNVAIYCPRGPLKPYLGLDRCGVRWKSDACERIAFGEGSLPYLQHIILIFNSNHTSASAYIYIYTTTYT